MASLISSVTTLVTGAVSWLGEFARAVVGYTPALEPGHGTFSPNLLTLAVVAIPLVGLGAGLLKRLISTKV